MIILRWIKRKMYTCKKILKHRNYKNIMRMYEREKKKVNYLLEHFDISDMKPATGYLRKRQMLIMDFMEEAFAVLENISIKPFLIGGNLIGWIRHAGFVPWDDDLDFGLMREDFNKLIDYAKKNWIVLEYQGEDKDQQSWIDKETQEHSNEYILFVYAAHIQISRGTSCLDRVAVDFFVYDYYNEKISFEQHNEYVKAINNKLLQCSKESERLDLVRKAVFEEKTTVEESRFIYFGMDSCEPYLRMFNTKWIDYETIFPLKEITYEGKNVFIPNNPELFMSYEYPNFKMLPDDFGEETHDYWKEYKRKNLITVEFYLVDAFEIAHFLPLYDFFRKKGVYAIFIAEPPEINVSNCWFDYENAIRILKKEEVEYEIKCNPDADFAFTTQRVNCLNKYKNKKINISYGCGLLKGQFGFMKESIEGFDYKFVHGDFTEEICKRNLNVKEWEKYKNIIFKMGYPKFASHNAQFNSDEVREELGIQTKKKIVGFLPTWGEQSCTEEFHDAIDRLRNKYFVITKPHHCTCRLESEKHNLQIINTISDLVLPAEYDISKMLSICDLVICSAESGVSLECPWLEKNIKLIFITKKNNEHDFFTELSDIAMLINNPNELEQAVSNIISNDPFVELRKAFVENVFGERSRDYLSDIFDKIFERKEYI